ncbi:ryanodine-sensitive calcium-release channel [Aureococcus anophagefferens]|nr:ryanodine-sensitive calcium-release channel [Aureococcus anophagefferens]
MVAARLLACTALGFALDYHNGNYNTAVDDVLYDTVIPASESPMTVERHFVNRSHPYVADNQQRSGFQFPRTDSRFQDRDEITLRNVDTGLYLAVDGDGAATTTEDAGAAAVFAVGRPARRTVAIHAAVEEFRPLLRGININGLMMMQYKAGYSLWKDADSGDNMFGKANDAWDQGADRCVGDDYSLSLELGADETEFRLGGHLATYITEKDISWMAHHGVNHVRVQVTYWMVFHELPYRTGTFAKLEQIFECCQNMAQSCGSCMKYTNCGIDEPACNTYRDSEYVDIAQDWDPAYEMEAGRAFRSADNQAFNESWPVENFFDVNVAVLTNLTTHFKDSPVYLGMIFTNEPSGTSKNDRLYEFYETMQRVVREVNGPDTLVSFFGTSNPMENLAQDTFTNPYLDKHLFSDSGHYEYQVFPDMELNYEHEMEVGNFNDTETRHWKYLIHAWSLTWGDAGAFITDDFMKCFGRQKLQIYERYTMGTAYCIWEVERGVESGPNYKWDYNDACEAGFLPGCLDEYEWKSARWWEHDPSYYDYYDAWTEACNPAHTCAALDQYYVCGDGDEYVDLDLDAYDDIDLCHEACETYTNDYAAELDRTDWNSQLTGAVGCCEFKDGTRCRYADDQAFADLEAHRDTLGVATFETPEWCEDHADCDEGEYCYALSNALGYVDDDVAAYDDAAYTTIGDYFGPPTNATATGRRLAAAHRALYSDRAEVKFCRAASADDDDDGASSKKKRSGPPPTHVAMVVVALATIATILFAGLCRAAKEPAAATKVVEMK